MTVASSLAVSGSCGRNVSTEGAMSPAATTVAISADANVGGVARPGGGRSGDDQRQRGDSGGDDAMHGCRIGARRVEPKLSNR